MYKKLRELNLHEPVLLEHSLTSLKLTSAWLKMSFIFAACVSAAYVEKTPVGKLTKAYFTLQLMHELPASTHNSRINFK